MQAVIEYSDLGTVPYREAWEMQERLRVDVCAEKAPGTLLMLEHPPVFTMGKRECGDDFCSTPDAIAADGIEIIKTNRGGRVTYHGPGQLVGYFICSLASFGMGIKDFVRAIEEILIRTVAGFGIDAHRDESHPGIWLGRKKIAALGLNVSHGITQHGFALNVDCDLSPYRHIIACGIKERSVTTMKIEGAEGASMQDVKASIIANTGDVLKHRMAHVAQSI